MLVGVYIHLKSVSFMSGSFGQKLFLGKKKKKPAGRLRCLMPLSSVKEKSRGKTLS